MGRLTRTCLKLCQSISNVLITPRFKGHQIWSTVITLFLCFISRWLEYANEINALGSMNLILYFNIGVFHRQSLPPTYGRPPLSSFKKNIFFQKNIFFSKKYFFFKKIFFFIFYFNIGVFHHQSLPPTYLRLPLPIFKKKNIKYFFSKFFFLNFFFKKFFFSKKCCHCHRP